MANMYGANVQQLNDLASAMDQAASQLSATRQSVGAKVQQSAWVGPVADRFRADWSASRNMQVAGAAQSMSDAAATLRRNAAEQTQASSAAGASGPARSLSTDETNPEAWLFTAGGAPWLTGVDTVTSDLGHLGTVLDGVPKVFGDGWAVLKTTGWSSAQGLQDAADWGIAQGPRWISSLDGFMSSPDVKFAGAGLAVVGAGFAVGAAVGTWADPKSTTWNKTESTVTAALSVGALIPGPQQPFVAVAAGAWVAGTWVYDNHAAIEQWAGNTAQAIGNAESTIAPVVQQVATAAVQQGEQVATNLSKDVTSFFAHW